MVTQNKTWLRTRSKFSPRLATARTVRAAVTAKLEAIIAWTMTEGKIKSPDHCLPKRLAEEALHVLEPALDRVPDTGPSKFEGQASGG